MRKVLQLHPGSICPAAASVEVELACPRTGSLALSYVVTGRIAELRIPPLAAAARTDELWQHTCFEAFVRTSSGTGYYEFNFAPSTQWAAYWLDDYRSGMRGATEIGTLPIEVHASAGSYTLRAALELDRLACLPRDAGWHLGLSALIEEADGRKSYWALAHPPGKPDFHHADCFAHEFFTGLRP